MRTKHETVHSKNRKHRASLHTLNVLVEGENEDCSLNDDDMARLDRVNSRTDGALFSSIFFSEPPTLSSHPDDKPDDDVKDPITSKNDITNRSFLKIVLIFFLSACVGTSLGIAFLVIDDQIKSKVSSLIQTSFYDQSNKKTQLGTEKRNNGVQSSPLERVEIDSLPPDYTEKPQIVDLPGAGSSSFPMILSECIGENNISGKWNPEFLTATSFCNQPWHINQNQRAQIFMLVRNPLARTAQLFIEKQNQQSTRYDKKVAKMNISECIESSLCENNLLTRVVTCKIEGSLYSNDLQRAKEFFDSKHVSVGVFPNSISLINNFRTHLGLNISYQMQKCIDSRLQKASMLSDVRGIHRLVGDNSKILREANEYDIELFMHILKKEIKDS